MTEKEKLLFFEAHLVGKLLVKNWSRWFTKEEDLCYIIVDVKQKTIENKDYYVVATYDIVEKEIDYKSFREESIMTLCKTKKFVVDYFTYKLI